MAHKNDPSNLDPSRIHWSARPGGRTQLKKIQGGVINNIYKWLWTRSKRIRIDPRKPWKKKTVEESKLHANNIRYTFVRIIDMVNLMIEEIAKVPPLEEKVLALEEKFNELELDYDSHKGNSSAHHVKTPARSGGTGGKMTRFHSLNM